MIQRMLAIWSLIPQPFKIQLEHWEFSVYVLLKPGFENFEHYCASMWNECNCAVVWTFFDIALLWDWNENCLFPLLWPMLKFPYFLPYWMQQFHSIIFYDLKQLSWNSITSSYSKYWITQWPLNTMSWHHSPTPASLDASKQPLLPDPESSHPMTDIVQEEGECCWVLFPQNFSFPPLLYMLLKQVWGYFK